MVALLVGGGQLLAAVLADVAGMARSALPVVHWEAQEVSLGPVLLCWGASVFEGIRKHLELSLMLALTYLLCTLAPYRLLKPLLQRPHTKRPGYLSGSN